MEELEIYLKQHPEAVVSFHYRPELRSFQVNVQVGPLGVSQIASELESRSTRFLKNPTGSSLALYLAIRKAENLLP